MAAAISLPLHCPIGAALGSTATPPVTSALVPRESASISSFLTSLAAVRLPILLRTRPFPALQSDHLALLYWRCWRSSFYSCCNIIYCKRIVHTLASVLLYAFLQNEQLTEQEDL